MKANLHESANFFELGGIFDGKLDLYSYIDDRMRQEIIDIATSKHRPIPPFEDKKSLDEYKQKKRDAVELCRQKKPRFKSYLVQNLEILSQLF